MGAAMKKPLYLIEHALLLVALAGCITFAKGSNPPHPASINSQDEPSDSPLAKLASCPVTPPNGSTPPGEQPSALNHGNGVIWTEIWPEGTVVFEPGGPGHIYADGSLEMKFPWWRGEGVRDPLSIEGHRLDAPSPPLRADIPEGYGDTGFQASSITFPSEGCWQVTGSAGSASLTFVTRVIRK